MDSDEENALIVETRKLRRDGQIDGARRILLSASAAQSVAGMVELADLALDEGKKAESDAWMRKAEAAVRPGNDDDHLRLHYGYSLGLGQGNRFDTLKSVFYHLEQAAQYNFSAQESVALHYLEARNGIERDLSKFEYWIKRAIAVGSPRAVYIYVEYLFRSGQPIFPGLIAVLENFRADNKAAAKLLKAIEKRAKKKPR
jgi:TPR repeat protein